MADDETTEALRAELARRDEADEQRHRELLDAVARRDPPPLTQADASRAMERGYAANAAEREAEKGGES